MAEGAREARVGGFVSPPSYTQIPNELLDQALPAISSLAELKVLLAIARRTFGWATNERRFSLSQLMELTGLSRQSAQSGVTSALEHGYLKRRKEGHGYVYGIPIADKNLGSNDPENESRKQTDLSLDSRPPSIEGKKTPAESKEKNARPGAAFVADPDTPADQVVVELYELWTANTTQPDGTVLTNKRAGQARQRLREQADGCEPDTALAEARRRMIEGLEGWFGSTWHQSKDAFDWETFFRSRTKVDAFRRRHQQQNGNGKTNRHREYDDQIQRGES